MDGWLDEGSVGMDIGVGARDGRDQHISKGSAIGVLVLMCSISAAFGWSWGPLTWLVPTEILPMEVRPVGQGISIACNFVLTFILAQVFLAILCRMKYGVFLFYAGWVLIMSIFVALFVPETKGFAWRPWMPSGKIIGFGIDSFRLRRSTDEVPFFFL
jgi:hypothetical protein